MPVDLSILNASITALTTEVGDTETLDASVEAFIAGFAAQIQKAVADALTADAAANAASITAANQAIADVTARFTAARGPLAAAITSTPPAGG